MELGKMIRIVGVGCRAEATQSALGEAIEMAMIASAGPLDAIATTTEKADTAMVKAVAKQFNLSIIAIDPVDLFGKVTPTQSPRILARFGTGSLAEAVAMAGCEPNAKLLCSRQISSDGMATAAIAQGDSA
jgi:cobalt-precorrin 5A hydrolase